MCWATYTWKLQTSMSILRLEFYLPQHSVEDEKLFKYFRSGKSFCRKLCSGQSFLCTLLECGRALMNEELSGWRELFQRLHLSHSVYRGAGDKQKALWLAGSLSLNCCSAGRFVSDSVCVHGLAIPVAQQHLSVDTFPVVLNRVPSGSQWENRCT